MPPTRAIPPTGGRRDITYALQQAARYHMRVLLQVSRVPAWANGNRGPTYPPTRIGALADFLTAAARRYPGIHLWMIWGEVTARPQLRARSARAPHRPPADTGAGPGATRLRADARRELRGAQARRASATS